MWGLGGLWGSELSVPTLAQHLFHARNHLLRLLTFRGFTLEPLHWPSPGVVYQSNAFPVTMHYQIKSNHVSISLRGPSVAIEIGCDCSEDLENQQYQETQERNRQHVVRCSYLIRAVVVSFPNVTAL